MTEPLFSIVTITYQNLAGLRGTVQSTVAQTFGDYEHIVVDGGSTDGSKEWLQANFTGTWVSEPDRGPFHAMNKGAAMATGRYLWFLHAGDNFGDSTVLARIAPIIGGDGAGRPEWLYGFARVVDPGKSLTGIIGFAPFTMFKFAIQRLPIPHQATVMKRTVFEQIGGYDESVKVAADQVLLMAAATRCHPLALADFLCDFDSTGISANRPWSEEWRDDIKVLRQLQSAVTRWRTSDLALAFSYSASRHLARVLRNRMVRSR